MAWAVRHVASYVVFKTTTEYIDLENVKGNYEVKARKIVPTA